MDILKLHVKPHTIFVFTGYPSVGAESIAHDFGSVLAQKMQEKGIYHDTTALIDVHKTICTLAGREDLEHWSPIASEFLAGALPIVNAEFDAVTTFPTHKEFVIFHGRPDFLPDLFDKAEARGYEVTLVHLALPDSMHAFTKFAKSHAGRQIEEHRSTQFPKEFKDLLKLPFDSVIEWNAPTFSVEIESLDLYAKSHLTLEKGESFAVIGDVHEDTSTFLKMLDLLRHEAKEQGLKLHIAQLGDYLDKGYDTESILKAMEEFIKSGGRIVPGNHESYVYKRLKGIIPTFDKEKELLFFSSITFLMENEESRNRFFNLFENHTTPFLRVEGKNCRTIYVTHAPCRNRYLGRITAEACKHQRNLTSKHRPDYREEYEFIHHEARDYHPVHIFGHVAHRAENLQVKNKVFLDTGSVYGNKLSAYFSVYGYAIIVQVESNKTAYGKPLESNATTKIGSEIDSINTPEVV